MTSPEVAVPEADKTKWGRWSAALVVSLLALAVAGSFLPLIETNVWWIRYFDFPRLQLAIALLLLLAAAVALRSRVGRVGWGVVVLGVLALGYQTVTLYPYSPFPAHAAVGRETCDPESSLTLMIANVQEKNEEARPFLDLVAEVDPDLLLVMETDEWWDRHLAEMQDRYPEKEQFIPEDHGAYGMHVLSKLPLTSFEFLFLFDAYTPTAVADVELRNGETIQFLGMHPHPPLAWSQPTTLRDGSLLTAGLLSRASEAATIVAGDFNAVPWEPVTRRAARIGGLLDPRIGRGFLPTFSADSVLITWPLDQILFQAGFGLLDFEVLPQFGSDHHPVMARLCHDSENVLRQTPPEPEPDDLEEAERSIEAAEEMKTEGRS